MCCPWGLCVCACNRTIVKTKPVSQLCSKLINSPVFLIQHCIEFLQLDLNVYQVQQSYRHLKYTRIIRLNFINHYVHVLVASTGTDLPKHLKISGCIIIVEYMLINSRLQQIEQINCLVNVVRHAVQPLMREDVTSAPCLYTLLTSVVAAIVPSCLCSL